MILLQFYFELIIQLIFNQLTKILFDFNLSKTNQLFWSGLDKKEGFLHKNFRKRLTDVYNPINLVKHTYDLFNNLDGVVAA